MELVDLVRYEAHRWGERLPDMIVMAVGVKKAGLSDTQVADEVVGRLADMRTWQTALFPDAPKACQEVVPIPHHPELTDTIQVIINE